MASVAGLAPARACLKGRLRGLLCIHGQKLIARGKNSFLTSSMNAKVSCSRCHSEILLADVNVSTDIALCRRCNQSWNYSELLEDATPSNIDPRKPPRGAWISDDSSRSFEVGVSTRSAGAFFLVPFMCSNT